MSWVALALTLLGVVGAEALAFGRGHARARQAHADLRDEWLQAVSQQRGSEVLAVQTLRNSLMSATMVASVAVLGLMGTVSLGVGTLHQQVPDGIAWSLTPRMAAALVLVVLLFLALAASALAARSYHHAGFVAGMPVGSPERERWQRSGAHHLRVAGVLYGWSLRCLLAVAAPVAFLLHPLAGPVAAAGVLALMLRLERSPVT